MVLYRKNLVGGLRKMYVCIDLFAEVKAGEVVIVRSDERGGIGAFLIGGEQVGKLSAVQPEGCLGYWTIASVLYDNRVICEAAVRSGNHMILHTESRLLAAARPSYHRVVVEGYGMAVVR